MFGAVMVSGCVDLVGAAIELPPGTEQVKALHASHALYLYAPAVGFLPHMPMLLVE